MRSAENAVMLGIVGTPTWRLCQMIAWDFIPAPNTRVQTERIAAFDARGMRRVYGRGDRFGHMAAFNMDIWCDRKGHLFARFWSRSAEVDGLSLAIHGIPPESVPKRA